MTQKEFYDACASHDWYCHFSDDNRVYLAGEAQARRLLALAKTDSGLQTIWDAWHSYMFSGKAWGTVQAPRPTYEMFGLKEDSET